ncbi:MAG: hypothetical protein ACIAZJ_08390 [Gimesia chilikensis]|uniref:hypothetical protein n=1 Tax=Gimesia chilikensis TaxID=2605989 RepID=UPI00379D5B67
MPRIKLAYPKIPDSRAAPLEKCIAFEKYDGTNLHWVWEPELGWYAFGTRRNRFDLDDRGIAAFTEDHPELAQAPALFLEDFGHLPVARVVYRGRFTGQFTSDVRAGKYAVAEGVICKGGTGPNLWMAKIKTDAYLSRLKTAFADNWEQYWE